MKNQSHLEAYDLIVTTAAPLFIGSGRSYTKKEYCFDTKKNEIIIIDEDKFISWIQENKLMSKYENYIFYKPNQQLMHFMKEWNVTDEELEKMTRYKVGIGDALKTEKPLAEIMEFVKDGKGRLYVPGSSVKGALRTLILQKIIRDKGKTFESGNLQGKAKEFESSYLNILQINKKKPEDEVNSIMRGIQISDSEEIRIENITLCRKDDLSTSGNLKRLPIIREAVKPGIDIRMKLVLDKSVASIINIEFLRDAIKEFGTSYKELYLSKFTLPYNVDVNSLNNCIYLGGGPGYFSKNIIYTCLKEKDAVNYVGNLMTRKFKLHKHDNDWLLGISPGNLKMTTYNNSLYHMGACTIELKKD